METLFTGEQFYGVFRDCNKAVWPAHLCLVAVALAAVSALLGFFWARTAVAYHLGLFTRISGTAYAFAAASMTGAAAFIWQGVIRRSLEFKWGPGLRANAGVALIVLAAAVVGIGLLVCFGQRQEVRRS